ncbi:MAG: type VI secretion system tube protein Hcp [Opitutaceae bacterium]|jgi:type VI protein secretion system component Hcp|nr:type VI secretion system tube protein Hcp [Opitutaceae bacterium]
MAFEAYLYIEGVRGDATSAIAKAPPGAPAGSGPIAIKSFGLNIEMPQAEDRSATGAVSVGRANFADFETAKTLDISTTALLFFCLAGKHINQVLLRVFRSVSDDDTSKPTLYLEAVYTGVVLTEVGVSGSGDEMPSETLKFNYATVKYNYMNTDKKTGKATGGKTEFSWDRTTNAGAKS